MSRLRVGVVGLGFGQAVTIPVFQAHPDCEVVGLVSTRFEKANAIATELGVPQVYRDWQEMVMSARLDILAIATPADVQVEILKSILKPGIKMALFIEKPVTITYEESKQVLSLWEQAGRPPVAVDFEFPEIAEWQKFRQVAQQTSSTIQSWKVIWKFQNFANKNRLENWKMDSKKGGGVVHAFASHVFYNLEWMAGPIKRLKAQLGKNSNDPRPTLTKMSAEFELTSGILGQIEIDSDCESELRHEWQFQLKEGVTWSLRNSGSDYIRGFEILRNELSPALPDLAPVETWRQPFVAGSDGRRLANSGVVSQLVNCLRYQKKVEPDLGHGVRVQQLMAAAEKSHHCGKEWIDV